MAPKRPEGRQSASSRRVGKTSELVLKSLERPQIAERVPLPMAGIGAAAVGAEREMVGQPVGVGVVWPEPAGLGLHARQIAAPPGTGRFGGVSCHESSLQAPQQRHAVVSSWTGLAWLVHGGSDW